MYNLYVENSNFYQKSTPLFPLNFTMTQIGATTSLKHKSNGTLLPLFTKNRSKPLSRILGPT
jgi:hypothetical protein